MLVAAEPRSEVRHAKPCLELLGDLHRLYLIHQPIVFAIALALKDNNTLLLLLVTAVPASLLAAEILWRLSSGTPSSCPCGSPALRGPAAPAGPGGGSAGDALGHAGCLHVTGSAQRVYPPVSMSSISPISVGSQPSSSRVRVADAG